METFGTAAWKLKLLIGLVLVLIVDTASTCMSGRGRSFPKCSKIFIPFFSYSSTGAKDPEHNDHTVHGSNFGRMSFLLPPMSHTGTGGN